MPNNASRQIDVTIHELTAAQTLEELLRKFRESTKEPISIFVKRGEGKEYLARVRTELTRVRKAYEAAGKIVPQFGFRVEGPFPIHSHGIPKEGFAVHYRITGLQQMKVLAQLKELS